MFFELLRLQYLKTIRSVSLSRNLIGGIIIGFVVFIVLLNLLALAFILPAFLEETFAISDPLSFINGHLFYFFLIELLYRFFLQKLPVFELGHFLHLPVKRAYIIHFLLGKSMFTSLSFVALICFGPTSIMLLDMPYTLNWLLAIVCTSWTVHWLMLWYKQKLGDHFVANILLFSVISAIFGARYFGLINTGKLTAPFYTWAEVSALPAAIVFTISILGYLLCYRYYKAHAYIEELSSRSGLTFSNTSLGILSRFGLPGEMANLEWKLILRHKKSRTYLLVSVLFLLYGLFFYDDPSFKSETSFSYFYIFIGTFITGSFMTQYGQLFLSWNSESFDFYLAKYGGINALVKGKYLLFFVLSTILFLLSVPYVYFGWEVLAVHLATFLFNMGVSIHFIIYLAMWKPKPIDLSQSGMFNYEGMGMAQFLIAIPLLILPYLVFIPAALLLGDFTGLFVLGAAGILGLIFYDRLSDICVSQLKKHQYAISESFRQEL